jgi:hypothetical protein
MGYMFRFVSLKKIILFFILVLAGCTTTANLYPVRGPMSEQNPLPVLVAHVDGILGNTGNISLTMPDGEVCKGKWSSAAGLSVGFGTVNLFTQYEAFAKVIK